MVLMRLIRKFKNIGISGAFARWYDKNTKANRIGEMQSYAKEVSRFITEKSTVLEVAPGPGYFAIELAKIGNYHITGMDISLDFVEICKTNAQHEKVTIDFMQGNVSEMPFDECSFNFVFCSAAFKNFKEPVKSLTEIYRVLKKDGVCLIVDMNRESSKETLNEEANKISKTGFERWFMRTAFKGLCKGAYSKEEIEEMVKQTLFQKCDIKEEGITLYIYLYK